MYSSKLNSRWSVRAIGTIQSVWRGRRDGAELEWRAMKSTNCQRRRGDNESEDNRLGDVSHHSQPRRMRSVNPNCLRDKSSVSSSLRGSLFSSTHLRVRTLALSSATRSTDSVIRYTWEEQTVSFFLFLSFSVWFVRISGCRHARLTIAASANREERSSSTGEIETQSLRHLLLRS